MRKCLLMAACFVAGASACNDRGAPSSTSGLQLVERHAESDTVLAVVSGRAITESALRRELAPGEAPRLALARLVDAELLTEEALRRKLLDDPEVVAATRQMRVQRLLADFETTHDKASIPERDLALAYNGRKKYFVHPTMASVWHILVPSRNQPPASRAAGRTLADQVQTRAVQVHSVEEFKRLSKEFAQANGAPLVLEELIADPDTIDRTFVRAAVALANPGDVSPVVETEFGFHVIFLQQKLAARHLTLEQATPELRDKLALDYQVRSFAKYVDELLHQHKIEKFDDRLALHSQGHAP